MKVGGIDMFAHKLKRLCGCLSFQKHYAGIERGGGMGKGKPVLILITITDGDEVLWKH